ncbi:MAG: NUDIX hydrolase [Anaerolineae bacterium]
MTEKTRPWHILSRRTLYASPWVNLHLARVQLPDGSIIEDHHIVDYPQQAVGVVAIGADGRALLIDHYRFITDTRGWEIPAGTINPGESPEEAAHREVMEETGYSVGSLLKLGLYHPSNGSSNQVFHMFVGRDLKPVNTKLDRNETLDLRWFTAAEVRHLIETNSILDGMSLTGLLWAIGLDHL